MYDGLLAAARAEDNEDKRQDIPYLTAEAVWIDLRSAFTLRRLCEAIREPFSFVVSHFTI